MGGNPGTSGDKQTMNVRRDLKEANHWLSLEAIQRSAKRTLPLLLRNRSVHLAHKNTILKWIASGDHKSDAVPANLAAIAAQQAIRNDSNDPSGLAAVGALALAARAAAYGCKNTHPRARSEAASSAAAQVLDKCAEAAAIVLAERSEFDDKAVASAFIKDVEEIRFSHALTTRHLHAFRLWPEGEPQWYLDAQVEAERVMEEQRKEAAASGNSAEVEAIDSEAFFPNELVISVEGTDGQSPEEVARIAAKIFGAAHRLHQSLGGKGLTVGKIKADCGSGVEV